MWDASYLRECRGCRPAAASVTCWTSCLHLPAAASEGHRCPGSWHQGSDTHNVPVIFCNIMYNKQNSNMFAIILWCIWMQLFFPKKDHFKNGWKYKWDKGGAVYLSGLEADSLQSSESQVVPVSELSEPTDDAEYKEKKKNSYYL